MIGLATMAGSTQAQGIDRSAHDLRTRVAPMLSEDSAMCVFCHAPVGERAASAQAPRWQPSAKRGAGFVTYAAPMSEVPSGPEIAGASMICLSCHDATQAPGITGGASDHPIGIPYAGASGLDTGGVWQPATIGEQGRAHRRDATGAAPSPRIVGRSGFRPPSRSVIDQREAWWVPTSPNSARRTRSDLPLYGSVASGAGPFDATLAAPTVECGTCHDPHAPTAMFLRVPNAGSRLCLSCHDI